MAIDPDAILGIQTDALTVSYGDREVILYALGVGFGHDPLDAAELPFVYENGLKTVPTLATALGWGVALMNRMGIDFSRVVHGGQRLRLTRPLPVAATVILADRVIGAYDKGPDKGAVIVTEKTVRDAATGELICTLTATLIARADGGFGGPRDGAPQPHTLPHRRPGHVIETPTRPDQALLYALSGDRNPLHRDPAAAARAGFPRPILQGLCTYGIACRAIITGVLDHASHRISAFDARFSAPVFPGETLVTEIWTDGPVISFRTRVKERDLVVLDNGRCETGF